MLSRQEEEQERIETLRNDQFVRQQQRQAEASTMHQHAVAQADETNQGRFAATGVPTVTGSTPIPKYPAASPSWQIQLPDEPPLGFDNPALEEPSTLPASVEATGGDVSAAPSADTMTSAGSSKSERSASSLFFSPDDGGFDDAA
jgi:hypothetical protein